MVTRNEDERKNILTIDEDEKIDTHGQYGIQEIKWM